MKRRVVITGGTLEACAWVAGGSHRAMLTDLLSSAEFVDPGKVVGNIYADLALGEDDGPEQGPLLAEWEAVIEVRCGEKAIRELTIKDPDGHELQ